MGTGELLGENLTNCWGVTCDGLASRPGGVEILLAASCYGNRDKLRPDEPVGLKASLYIGVTPPEWLGGQLTPLQYTQIS